ncbi:MAG: hypothetical protein AVDCRST_MAG71-1901 [uncultured Lysobacter sp.]|uniref:Uncharacterized protein n=1 Tax=uncultured Lysobacter sp. TaxID=271060 RepID=A0A6J4LIP0_9GAMM|nr:MAG: hypothetical protein AVDCRST_MAG71-1901 [uncultured Lysobacter sp.]
MISNSTTLLGSLAIAAALTFAGPAAAQNANGKGPTNQLPAPAQTAASKHGAAPKQPGWLADLLKKVKGPKKPNNGCRG